LHHTKVRNGNRSKYLRVYGGNVCTCGALVEEVAGKREEENRAVTRIARVE